MAVKVDAGHVAKKTATMAAKTVTKNINAAAKTIKSATPNPSGNGSVTAKKAEITQTANLVRHNLTTSFAANTATPREQADEIIKANGGRNDLNTDKAGQDLAGIAISDPAEAKAVSEIIFAEVRDGDRDEVAQSFADALTDEQLRDVGSSKVGNELLELHKKNLLEGKVHRDERASAARLQEGIQGYPTPQLTGNHEDDIRTVAADLESLPPEKQAEYLNTVMEHPYGVETLQRAGILSADEQASLAQGLNSAYEADPSGFGTHMRELVETEKAFPVHSWTGFANVISQTGNDALIASYASKAINYASNNPEHNGVSVDAIQALSGMSPAALSNFINFRSINPPISGDLHGIGRAMETNKAQFQEVLGNAVSWLGGDANNVGFANPWAFNPALGNFLDTASGMTKSDGTPTSAAFDIFETIATKTGDNFYTKKAAGRFFIEHSQSTVDRYAALRNSNGSTNRNFDPEVLKDFFINVVYSPISHLLEYNGGSMTEAIMGNGAGNPGVIGNVAETLMDRAGNGEDAEAIGREIGYLFGAVSGGFLDSVEAYKDKFNDDKEFREFLYGIVNKGLGSLGKKAGIPLGKIGAFAQKLYEAGKSDERSAKLRGFQEAFLDLKDEMRFSLLDFENSHPDAIGLEESFTIGWTDFVSSYLATDWIAR